MGEPHVGRKLRIGLLVRKIVRNVGKESASRPQPLDQAERLRNRGVSGMRLVAQGVEKKNIEPAQQRKRAFGNFAEVGQVGGRTEAISVIRASP